MKLYIDTVLIVEIRKEGRTTSTKWNSGRKGLTSVFFECRLSIIPLEAPIIVFVICITLLYPNFYLFIAFQSNTTLSVVNYKLLCTKMTYMQFGTETVILHSAASFFFEMRGRILRYKWIEKVLFVCWPNNCCFWLSFHWRKNRNFVTVTCLAEKIFIVREKYRQISSSSLETDRSPLKRQLGLATSALPYLQIVEVARHVYLSSCSKKLILRHV